MGASQVASRYARALIVLAQEKGQLEGVNEDMLLIKKTVLENRDLRLMLDSPIVKSEQKEKVLQAIFAGKIGEVSLKFLDLLVKKKRESLIDDMTFEFEKQYMLIKGVIRAEVVSVEPLTAQQREEVKRIIREVDNKEVELIERLDPSILGGIIIRIGDKQIDHSVAGKLRAYKAQLIRNNA
jgi:F-type H+-transporting ATPase subunit delta